MKLTIDSSTRKGIGLEVRFLTTDDREELPPSIQESEFSGAPNSLLHFRSENLLYVGVGDREKVNAHRFRTAAGAAVMYLRKIEREQVTFALVEWPEFVGAAVEGAVLANYRFEEFKVRKTVGITALRIQVSSGDLAAARKLGARAIRVADATNWCRDIGNQPGNLLYPDSLAKRARRLTAKGLKCTVLDEQKLTAGGFGGILAVGAGSSRPPRLIVLEHRGGPKGQKPIALVGKAVTFDSGGISIKPAANMEEMIFDKCGGIAVLGAMAAIADLKVKQNVIGLIASAENMPSGTAFRPGDIISTYARKYVEIVNTDAEGRLVLADAIAHARKDYQARAIIDLATLTGACGVALGEYAAGLWSNDEALSKAVLDASERSGERLWAMPLFQEYSDQIRSDVALLKNSGGRLGGACTGAAFLQAFADGTPWAHLDIAYTSHRKKDQAHIARGANGFGVRTLIELVENLDK